MRNGQNEVPIVVLTPLHLKVRPPIPGGFYKILGWSDGLEQYSTILVGLQGFPFIINLHILSSGIVESPTVVNNRGFHTVLGEISWQDTRFPSKHLVGDHSLSRPPAISKAGHRVVWFLNKWHVNHPRVVVLQHGVSCTRPPNYPFIIYVTFRVLQWFHDTPNSRYTLINGPVTASSAHVWPKYQYRAQE